MQLSSVSTIQKPHRHRNHRAASGVAHQNVNGDCGYPLQADGLHFQRHMLALVDGSDCQTVDDHVFAQSRVNDKAKRSDTAKRHVLSRQKPIQKDEHQTSNSLRYTTPGWKMSMQQSILNKKIIFFAL